MLPIVLPTLPALPAVNDQASDRLALLAGLMFIEGAAASWGPQDVLEWFTTYRVALGRSVPPQLVTEIGVGTVALLSGARSARDTGRRSENVPKLLAMSRWRVIINLRGLLASPADDRFLHAAIFSGRVRRQSGAWAVEARDADPLSNVVLSLFAADILAYRDFHDQNLCICDACGRISYNPAGTTRSGCAAHPPQSVPTVSGYPGAQAAPRVAS